jgi:propane monooxygenase reductase component
MSFTITLNPFGRRFECEPEETILAAALRQGINLRYGCKEGGCGSCKTLVVEGEVDLEGCSSYALMDFERDEGWSLLCATKALSDVTLEIVDYDEGDLFGPPPD